MKFLGIEFGKKKTETVEESGPQVRALSFDGLPDYNLATTIDRITDWNGSKYPGGFGATDFLLTDYWTLRARSAQLFKQNLYARGLIRRLVTNIINVGLMVESQPASSILGISEDELEDWSEDVELRFEIWGRNPSQVDFEGIRAWGELQRDIYREALIEGDVLIILRPDSIGMPTVQMIPGSAIQTPWVGRGSREFDIPRGHRVEMGVELDRMGRQVAYWVVQSDGLTYKRVPAVSSRTGRRIAWMLYGTDKRFKDVRGEPILSIILQSLREVDRYRDAAQRKAVINSMLAIFIKKGEERVGSKPLTGGAVKKGTVTTDIPDGESRTFNAGTYMPGLILDELNVGEEPVAFGDKGTDVNFPIFESAMISGMAWAMEVPPEILQLAFSNNYSASQAAINEFKIFLNQERSRFGADFCQPIYVDWLFAEVLSGRVEAPGFLESWRDPLEYDVYGAWIFADWSGAIKPSTDIRKQAQGYELMVRKGWITNARATRELTGTKFSRNIKKLRKENEMWVAANEPILAAENSNDNSVEAAVAAAFEDFAMESGVAN